MKDKDKKDTNRKISSKFYKIEIKCIYLLKRYSFYTISFLLTIVALFLLMHV